METLLINQDSLAITWHPGCHKTSLGKYVLFGVGRQGPIASGVWKKPEVPKTLVLYIHSKTFGDHALLRQIIQEFRELEDIESELILKHLSSVEIRCDRECKFYQLMEKNGIFEKYYPEWYANGDF